MRTASVFTPRNDNQLSNGLGVDPTVFRYSKKKLCFSGSLVITAPPTTSLCPEMYFVVECTTTSTPRSNGFCKYGDANVLSKTEINPSFFASEAIVAISTTRMLGFVGPSQR